MSNYINEQDFFNWYEEVTGNKSYNSSQLLSEVESSFFATGNKIFTLPENRTNTGKPEKYEFKFENVGCCGASTFFFTFIGRVKE